MSSKRSKLTADKARERIASLEESISSRVQRLEQLESRIARTPEPEEKLLAAKERQERRLAIEREQVQKLRRVLDRRAEAPPQESGEFLGSEELDELHRSFEEVRQDLSQVKMRLENTDLPRDLPARLTSFEQRMGRREEADSDLFTQILNLQTALEQERQTVRRLSRRIREQDQNLDALREAVEDSVVATVDLAERLEELEDGINVGPSSGLPGPKILEWKEDFEQHLADLEDRIEEINLNPGPAKPQEPPTEEPPAQDSEPELWSLLAQFEERLLSIESQNAASKEQAPSRADEEVREPVPVAQAPSEPKAEDGRSSWIPAKFSSSPHPGRLVAKFSTGTPEKMK